MIAPKPQRVPIRRQRKGFMTIAAGVQFNGGVLLCADTQYSSQSIKFFDTKILRTSGHDSRMDDPELHLWSAAIAFSGTDGYMQMAVDQIDNALADFGFGPEEGSTVNNLREKISDVLVEFHKKHIYGHPHYGYMGGPSVSCLIGVYAHGGGIMLYSSNETAIKEISFVEPCAFIGSGREIAEYAIKPLIRPSAKEVGLSLEEAILLATHALRVAKKFDPNCGGYSEFAVIYDDGRGSSVETREILNAEDYSHAFDRVLQNLFYAAADPQDSSARTQLKISKGLLETISAEQHELMDERRSLARALRPKPRPSASQT
jgi:20S proteasome alpha/beta subunit